MMVMMTLNQVKTTQEGEAFYDFSGLNEAVTKNKLYIDFDKGTNTEVLHVKNKVNGIEKGEKEEHQEGYDLKNSRKYYTKYEQEILEETQFSPERAAPKSTIGQLNKAIDNATK